MLPSDVPRIEAIAVRNYRALKDLQLRDLSPLTVLVGPNGSGKSTLFDVFAFLSECFTVGLRHAWDRRGRFRELRTRGEEGPIVIELKYREREGLPLVTYRLAIDETSRGPSVAEESLSWRRGQHGKPFRFLDFRDGEGEVVSGEMPDAQDSRVPERLDSHEMLAVNTLGQLARHPRVSALRRFITGWYLSYITPDQARTVAEAGPKEKLSVTGDNLPNVIQYLKEQHPDRLDQILLKLSQRVPQLERVDSEIMPDGRLLLQIKDAPFERPILSRFASDGTLKMLSYLTVLYDPSPPPFIGIEEPENNLHPMLLYGLAEECREASVRTQLMVTTHSPYFVDGLRLQETWVLYRDDTGFTRAERASGMKGVPEMQRAGALLGSLWMENYFTAGDPRSSTVAGPQQRP
jgi:predicted ATPase